MTELTHERAFAGFGSGPSVEVTRPRMLGSIACLLFLAGCAGKGGQEPFFDYQSAAVQSPESTSAEAGPRGEQPKAGSASALLGSSQAGPNYTVDPTVVSNGRYNIYTFEAAGGTYSVTGDALARKHIQELTALEALKAYSPTAEFAHGVGDAVGGPIKGVFTTVTDPAGAAKATSANVERQAKSMQRGFAKAGEFVTTLGKPEKGQPSREDENLIDKMIDRSKEKRRLAQALGVDPNTHFVPLSNELTKVASYSAAGTFGVKRALGFVPGGAGMVISGIGMLNSVTTQTIDMAPDEISAINRERLQKLNISDPVIKKFLLSDKLTPTEKTLAVGYLGGLSGVDGLENLVAFVAESQTRHDAFFALQTLSYVSTQPFGSGPVARADIVHGIPIFTFGDARTIALLTSDHLFWTSPNARQLSSLGEAPRGNGGGAPKREMWVSGGVSDLAKRQLQQQGWVVKANIFSNSRWLI